MRLAALFLLTAALIVMGLAAGRIWMGLPELVQALSIGSEGAGRMVWTLRLPRVLAGVIVGAGLGLAGLVFQALLRNPLASPDVIGVSQSAAFGAVAALMAGWPVMLGAWRAGLGAVLVAAGVVSLCGPMGFVALAAGPVARLVAHGRPSPVAAALTGAGFVTLAAALARSTSPAALLPTGFYTALIGAPLLILTVRRMARRETE
jgi:ABC-type Fe3+-siderophore transport system permease subunit